MSGSILWNHEVPYFSFLYLHLPLLKLTISVRLETQFKIWIFSFQSLQMYCYWQELISKLAPASLCHLKAVPKTWQRELDINLTVQPEQIMALGKKKKEKKTKSNTKIIFKEMLHYFSISDLFLNPNFDWYAGRYNLISLPLLCRVRKVTPLMCLCWSK